MDMKKLLLPGPRGGGFKPPNPPLHPPLVVTVSSPQFDFSDPLLGAPELSLASTASVGLLLLGSRKSLNHLAQTVCVCNFRLQELAKLVSSYLSHLSRVCLIRLPSYDDQCWVTNYTHLSLRQDLLACMALHSLGSAENQRFRHCPRSLGFPRSARILSANQRQISVQTARFSMELSDWLALSHDTLCGRGCGWACGCARHNAKISLFCASKFSLTASYFRLIVSNLLSLHVQLPQTKAAFPAPKYCDTSPSERIVCCRIGGIRSKQNQRRKTVLKERVWLAGVKQGKCALPGGHSG